MKIALVLPGSIWFAPYVRIYTRLFEIWGVDYSLISWNREGDDKPEGYQYNVICKQGHVSASFSSYWGYVRFVKSTIKKKGFDRIIVFGPQMTCLLSLFLLTNYRKRYMIDYRDLSIEQKFGFKQLFSIMLKFSQANVISSPGFKRCLPKLNYYLSHNFNVELVKQSLLHGIGSNGFKTENGIDVLTIGAIRDYSSNLEIIKALGNKDGYNMRFIGKGDTATLLEDFCNKNSINNILFKGFYQKEEESAFIKDSTFLNIFYPRIITHDTALSNRFYNSLIFKKPMIVTKNTTQGDYAEEFKVGVAIENCENIIKELDSFLKNDYCEYIKRCNKLLSQFMVDQENFEYAIRTFIS